MIEVSRYVEHDQERWDAFIKDARNGHFMFQRDYMEYHADRFDDYSLLFEEKGKLIAVLPANRVNQTIYSHGGLTFGGIISGSGMTTPKILEVFIIMMAYCKEAGITKLSYKAIPHIYHNAPTEEDLYALSVNGAQLVRRDVSATLNQEKKFKYSKRRIRNLNKARRGGLSITNNCDYSRFWSLLDKVLTGRHGVQAVHSLEEIQRLAILFPQNIQLYEVNDSMNNLLAGSVLYISNEVVHTQYLANSEVGRTVGALDYLIDVLINEFRDIHYFDFGISTIDQGKVLNEGLCIQKEGYGARAIVHDFYELNI